MKRKTRTILLLITVVVLIVIVLSPRWNLFEAFSNRTAAVSAPDMRTPVSAYLIRPLRIDNKILSTGTVLANEEVELRSEISGKIEKILFREGSRVKRGDLLVKIDDAELQAQRVKLQFQEKLAEEKERRRRRLYEGQSISPEDYEISLNELNSIRADIQLVQARIEKTEITAPFDGVIGLRHVSEGSYVSPTATIATLQNLTMVKVDFSIPEKYAGEVRRDQIVRFRIAVREGWHTGKIYAVEPKIDPVTRTVRLRAISPNPEARLTPGAFAEVELVLEQIDNALMIPTEALVPELSGHKVYLYKGGMVHPQPVETGIRTETQVQILSGVRATDTLITSGILQMRPGMPVRITELVQ